MVGAFLTPPYKYIVNYPFSIHYTTPQEFIKQGVEKVRKVVYNRANRRDLP